MILQHLRQENKIYELISTEFEEDTPRDDKHKKMVGVGGYEMFTIEIDKVGEEYFMILKIKCLIIIISNWFMLVHGY